MATITPPTYSENFVIVGDLDIYTGILNETGTGNVYIRNGELFVNGLTELNTTTIVTNSGPLSVFGSNLITMNVTAAIELQAAATSYFQTSVGTLTLASTDTSAGRVLISAAGAGPNTIEISTSQTTNSQINVTSAGGSSSITPITISATDSTNGSIYLTAAGNYAASNPAIYLNATNTTSGMINLTSQGNTPGTYSVIVNAPGTTGGNILIEGSGNYTGNYPAIYLHANNTGSGGKILLESTHTATDSIWLDADQGGILLQGAHKITLNSTDTTNGVVIAPTSLVPVYIGSAGSLTQINGDLTVIGSTTTLNTVTLTVDNNVVILNSGSESSAIDAGIAVRRYQTPNNTGLGDVSTTPNPIQESGAFQSGSATPGTLVLAPYASSVDGYYVGWIISIISGAGISQVRRIKAYTGASQTATIYETSDNNANADNGPIFSDGLDLVTAPASGDLYELFNSTYTCSYYDETLYKWKFNLIASADTLGINESNVENPLCLQSGELDILPQTYNNANVVASGTTLTLSLVGHGVSIGYIVYLSNSSNLTPTVAAGNYNVVSVVDSNHFTVTAAASTTSASNSSISISILNSSILKANVIESYSPGFPINISGLTLTQYISIPKTSTSQYSITQCNTYGSYIIFVSDISSTHGAFAIFASAMSSTGTGASVSRLATGVGSEGQRIFMSWAGGATPVIYQNGPGSGSGNYTYFIRIYSGM